MWFREVSWIWRATFLRCATVLHRYRWITNKTQRLFAPSVVASSPVPPATVFLTYHTERTAKCAQFSVQEVFNNSFHILTHEKWFSKFFQMLELVQRELTKLMSPESSRGTCIWARTLSICFWFIYPELIKGLCREGCLMFKNTWGFFLMEFYTFFHHFFFF